MDQNQNSSLFQLNLDAQNSYTLRSAASWAKVLGVIGLVIGILCIISGVVTQMESNPYEYSRSGGFSSRSITNAGLIVAVITGLVMIITSIFALNAGNKIMQGLKGNDQASLNAGFAGIRNYFAFWAVLLIISLLFILLGIVGSV